MGSSKMPCVLYEAVKATRFPQVKYLLSNGMSPNIKNKDGKNSLVAALEIDNKVKRHRLFHYLLTMGARKDEADDAGRSVIMWAAILGRLSEFLVLLEELRGNLDLSQKDGNGYTLLHYATFAGDITMVSEIIKLARTYEISVDMRDDFGLTPYVHAVRDGLTEIASQLINQGGASTSQFDLAIYKMAHEWEDIGWQERVTSEKMQEKELQTMYKIIGKSPRPQSQKGPLRELTSVDKNILKRVLTASRSRAPSSGGSVNLMRSKTQLPTLNRALISGSTSCSAGIDRSLKYSEYPLATKRRDTAHIGHNNCRTQLSKMMNLLAEQHSGSYRLSAVPPETWERRRNSGPRRNTVGAVIVPRKNMSAGYKKRYSIATTATTGATLTSDFSRRPTLGPNLRTVLGKIEWTEKVST